MAEAVLVTGCGEGKIGNAGFAERVGAGDDVEGRGERRVKRRRGRGFVVALNPRELASRVQHHLLVLRRSPYGEAYHQSHGVPEGPFYVVGGRGKASEFWVRLQRLLCGEGKRPERERERD